ncbi:MAG TPA: DsbA family protein [Chitinophagaceae bacterium]|nr:DsbA family protein [Chitinophagaceae bacterium]
MATLKPAVSSKDHMEGNTQAPIELVEYGDYQCPHCGRAYPIIKNIQAALGDQLKFVFRNFPLAEIHPNATRAAIATEAAAAQGKFWPMHDYLFEHQQRLDDESLLRYASHLRLDAAKFRDDMENDALAQKVEDDFESGVRSGVNGTPSFFVNGQKYNGDWAEEPFLAYLKTHSK